MRAVRSSTNHSLNSAGKTFSGRRGKERVLLLDQNYVRWHKLRGLYMADSLFGW